MIRKTFFILSLLILLTSCTKQEYNGEISSKQNPHEGLNIFNISEEYGVLEGAYIEGEYRVDFQARRGEIRPLFSLLIDDPTMGYQIKDIIKNPSLILYDSSACFISKKGDPFIIMDSCSIPPLCLPADDPESENCQIDDDVRTKEIELAKKTGKELENFTFPKGLQREIDVITQGSNLQEELLNFVPVSSVPNN